MNHVITLFQAISPVHLPRVSPTDALITPKSALKRNMSMAALRHQVLLSANFFLIIIIIFFLIKYVYFYLFIHLFI